MSASSIVMIGEIPINQCDELLVRIGGEDRPPTTGDLEFYVRYTGGILEGADCHFMTYVVSHRSRLGFTGGFVNEPTFRRIRLDELAKEVERISSQRGNLEKKSIIVISVGDDGHPMSPDDDAEVNGVLSHCEGIISPTIVVHHLVKLQYLSHMIKPPSATTPPERVLA